MNDHTTALVPLETWAYESPLLARQGIWLDVGLLAEALIYYDRVLVVPAKDVAVGNVVGHIDDGIERDVNDTSASATPKFVELIGWFASRDAYGDLLALLRSGELGVFHYAFKAVAMRRDGKYVLLNVADEEQLAGPTFMRRIAGHGSLARVLPKARHREQLYRALEGRITEVLATDYTRAVKNATQDAYDAVAGAEAVQAIVDDVFALMGLKEPPQIGARVDPVEDPDVETKRLRFNVDLAAIDKALGPKVSLTSGIVLAGLMQSNRTLWSAAGQSCDLYLPTPLSRLTSRKLAETNQRRSSTQDTLDRLKAEVEFPDVRALVNGGSMTFAQVLRMRSKAKKFRSWLQTQADRDRDALIAYHHEVMKESGIATTTRKTLKLFGVIGGAAAGAAVGSLVGHPVAGAGIGSAVTSNVIEEAAQYLFDVAGKLDENWRPVVFGDWARDYVQHKDPNR